MEDLSLHILDIVENAIAAQADRIEIMISEDKERDLLSVEIRDNGKGMDKEEVERAVDPFYTTKTTRRIGLGLPLLEEAAKAANGRLDIQSNPGKGTTIKAVFQHSHIDRKPIGDMGQTLLTLVIGNPGVDLAYTHRKNSNRYRLDTKDIRNKLKGIPINSPDGIRMLKENLKDIPKSF